VVKSVVFAVPGDLATPTGGYAYDRRMVAELGAMKWRVEVVDLGAYFPRPTPAEREEAVTRLVGLPREQPIVIDGLAFGVLPDVAVQMGLSHKLIALVHHPLALESGLSVLEAESFRQSERAALGGTRGVIATSHATRRLLVSDYGVPIDRITVAPPGTDHAPPARGSSDDIVRLLAVGSLVPRKGYDVLIAALSAVTDLPWQLTIAGDATRDRDHAARIESAITRFGLADRITLAGAVSHRRLDELYSAADLFVLASRFEGYGMAYADAIARGLPVIGTTAGAIPDTVPKGTGVLVPPDDPVALTRALRTLIMYPEGRRKLSLAALEAAGKLPTWEQSAKIFARAIEAAA
jgi:glycosyltransferase involved in cell wall biosynthesis